MSIKQAASCSHLIHCIYCTYFSAFSSTVFLFIDRSLSFGLPIASIARVTQHLNKSNRLKYEWMTLLGFRLFLQCSVWNCNNLTVNVGGIFSSRRAHSVGKNVASSSMLMCVCVIQEGPNKRSIVLFILCLLFNASLHFVPLPSPIQNAKLTSSAHFKTHGMKRNKNKRCVSVGKKETLGKSKKRWKHEQKEEAEKGERKKRNRLI